MDSAVQPSAVDVREELSAICAHRRFVKSLRLMQLLRFIVAQKLSGHSINEQLIGVSIFGRQPGYDSANDTIVRTQASELRKRLEEYYRDNRQARVRISIARGTYNPVFSWVYDESRGTGEVPGIADPPQIAEEVQRPEEIQKPAEERLEGPRWERIVRARQAAVAAVLVVLIAVFAGAVLWRTRHRPVLKDKETVVMADFVNTTGEAIFDGTLGRALGIELEQTPFLHILPDGKVQATLKLMNQPQNTKLTDNRAQEICERTSSKAVIEGSIASVGTPYLIALTAVNCETAETLASAEVTAKNRDMVLSALKKAAIQLRQKLGESLASIQRFNKPLDTVTTSSLEALKTYSEGMRLEKESGWTEAIPYFQRAIELDPNFGQAYLALGVNYRNSGEIHLAQSNLRKAFESRDRVTEHERLVIMATYYLVVTGELPKSLDTSRRWARTYPEDVTAHVDLSAEYEMMGDYEQCAAQGLEAIRLDPDNFSDYGNTVGCYYSAGRRDEAKELIQRARARGFDSAVGFPAYLLAFLDGDQAEMRREVKSAKGQRWIEDAVLSSASDTEAYHGRLRKARERSAEAVDSAERHGAKEAAALWKVNEALREAEFGDAARAREYAKAAMARGSDRDVGVLAALALARAGESAQAGKILARLDAEFPLDSLLQHYWFPTIRSAIELDHANAQAAIEALQGKTGYELGNPEQFSLGPMYPVYVRGEAYLKAQREQDAAEQFRKIIEHPGVIVNFPLGSLAHLQLARALAVSGDRMGARREYQDFFALLKDADSDIPILKQAKAEYAKLH